MPRDKPKAIHRWQPTGKTPCGRPVDGVATNLGMILNDGVTCRRCRRARTRMALIGPHGPLPNGVL